MYDIETPQNKVISTGSVARWCLGCPPQLRAVDADHQIYHQTSGGTRRYMGSHPQERAPSLKASTSGHFHFLCRPVARLRTSSGYSEVKTWKLRRSLAAARFFLASDPYSDYLTMGVGCRTCGFGAKRLDLRFGVEKDLDFRASSC